MNIALILECLRREAPLSRADLAQMTGLTKATVSSLVKELLDARFVRESGLELSHKGRPAIQLVLNPEAGYIVGAEIGVDFVSAMLTNFAAEPVWWHHEPVPEHDQQSVLRRIVAIVREACAHAPAGGNAILGLGLGLPGLVDVTSGTLLFSANLGWTGVPLRSIFEAEFDFPIYIDNDANMAALGESFFGAGRGSDFVLYIGAGVGLGGGVVLNRRILAGAAGLAGEVGHMTIDPRGPTCNCGNTGCWETFVNQAALARRIEQAAASGQPTRVAQQRGRLGAATIAQIIAAARDGDLVAHQALEDTGEYLGIGLANLVNALNPHRVVLGGKLAQAHDVILPVVRRVVRTRALRWASSTAEIVSAAHGSHACAMGGIATVYNRVLAQPLSARRRPEPARRGAGRLAAPAAIPPALVVG